MTVLSAALSHSHAWQLAEVEYVDSGSVRRLECACGEIDYRSDS